MAKQGIPWEFPENNEKKKKKKKKKNFRVGSKK